MMLNPSAQEKAQAEIDAVVGHGRLPDWEDRSSLPYIECVMHEVMRYVLRPHYMVLLIGTNILCLMEDGVQRLLSVRQYNALTQTNSSFASAGIPRTSSADDVYNGMFLPKGATIVVNILYAKSFSYTSPFRWLTLRVAS